MYLFKTSSGKWVFGKTIKSTCSAGSYRLDPNADFSVVEIYHLQSNSLFFSGAPTVFLKESGTAYADFTEFFTACEDFFFKLDTLSDAELELASTTFYNKTQIDAWKTANTFLQELQDFGSDCKAFPIGMSVSGFMSGTLTLEDGKLYEVAFRLDKSTVITGVRAVQRTQGIFTPDNYCGFGVHSTAAGVATKITETVNDGNLFKGADYSLIQKAFPTPQTLAAGIYKITMLWSASATTTAPVIYQHSTLGLMHTFLLANSNKLSATLAAQTAIPTTITASATSAHNAIPAIWLY